MRHRDRDELASVARAATVKATVVALVIVKTVIMYCVASGAPLL